MPSVTAVILQSLYWDSTDVTDSNLKASVGTQGRTDSSSHSQSYVASAGLTGGKSIKNVFWLLKSEVPAGSQF